jgi:hypothetical protein
VKRLASALNVRILAFAISAAIPVPAVAQSGHYPITVDRIVAAMNNMGLAIAPAQVTLVSSPVAATPGPRLSVRSIERWNDARMMVRLECEDSAECVPFFVAVRTSPTSVNAANVAAVNPASRPAPIASPAGSRSYTPPVLRAGSSATLLLEGNHIHIRLSVICLDGGSPGQTIHVTDAERREVYTAQIVNGSTLEGRL